MNNSGFIRIITLTGDLMATLAIDIGGTKISAAIIGQDRKLTMIRLLPTPHSKSIHDLNIALSQLLAPLIPFASRYAVASTGIIEHGVLTALNPSNLGGLALYPLEKYLNDLTGLPGVVINDAQAAAWAEYSVVHEKIKSMVYITVSTGVGGGIIHDRKLLSSETGLAGNIGHLISDINGPLCGCGRRGCVEAVASGTAIMNSAQKELAGHSTKDIFLRAAKGDPEALKLKERSTQAIAGLIADLKMLTDCQLVVIGGSVGLARGYISSVSAHLSKYPEVYYVPVAPAVYRHNSGMLGATMLAETRIK